MKRLSTILRQLRGAESVEQFRDPRLVSHAAAPNLAGRFDIRMANQHARDRAAPRLWKGSHWTDALTLCTFAARAAGISGAAAIGFTIEDHATHRPVAQVTFLFEIISDPAVSSVTSTGNYRRFLHFEHMPQRDIEVTSGNYWSD